MDAAARRLSGLAAPLATLVVAFGPVEANERFDHSTFDRLLAALALHQV